jgi:hypothetical protein
MFPAATFQPATFRAWRPTVLPLRKGPSISQAVPPSAARAIGAGVLLGTVSTAVGIAASYVGIRTGVRESGFLSILGYVVGAAGALYTLSSAVATIALALVGPAVAEEVAKRTQTTQTSQP